MSWVRYALLVGVALGLGLMCASIATGSAGPTASSADMGSMSAMDMSPDAAQHVAAAAPAPMAGMCDAACAAGTVEAVCSVVAVAAPLTLLGLLLTRRRESYLGLLTRTTGPFIVRREHRRWRGWSVLSPISLCVWRV